MFWLQPLPVYIVTQVSVLGVQPGLWEMKTVRNGVWRQLGELNPCLESSGRGHLHPSAPLLILFLCRRKITPKHKIHYNQKLIMLSIVKDTVQQHLGHATITRISF